MMPSDFFLFVLKGDSLILIAIHQLRIGGGIPSWKSLLSEHTVRCNTWIWKFQNRCIFLLMMKFIAALAWNVCRATVLIWSLLFHLFINCFCLNVLLTEILNLIFFFVMSIGNKVPLWVDISFLDHQGIELFLFLKRFLLSIQDLNLFEQEARRQVALRMKALSLCGIFVLVFIRGWHCWCLIGKLFNPRWLSGCFGAASILIYLSYASSTILLTINCGWHEIWWWLVQRGRCGCDVLLHVLILSSDYHCILRWKLLAWLRMIVETRWVIIG